MKKVVLILLIGMSYQALYAGGFQVVLQGVRQTSMGNVATAIPDAASIFFNPGALAMLENNVVSAGVSPVLARVSYQDAEPFFTEARTDNPPSLPFFFYAAFGFGPENQDGIKRLKGGLGVFTPFGSTVRWEDGWIHQTNLRELSLRAIYIQPTLSFMLNDYIGIGAGLDIVLGSVYLQRAIADPTTGNFAKVEFEGNAETALGYNLGVFVKSPDGFSIGINYRSRVNANVKGGNVNFDLAGTSQTFQNQFAVLNPEIAANNNTTRFDATLPLPGVLTVGFAYSNDKFTIGTDFRYTQWNAYRELRFDFADPINGANTSVSQRKYQDAVAVCLGAEYSLTDALKLRAGTYYDFSPVPDGYMTPETPDANALGLTFGLGYNIGNLSINAGYLFVNREQRSQFAATDANSINGTFKAQAHVPTIGISYSF